MSMTSAVGALRPAARSMAWGPLTGAAAALALIVVALRPWDGHRLSLSLVRIAAALVAVSAAFGIDDAGAVTLAASPTSLGHRRTTRLVLVVIGATAVAATACLSVVALGGSEDLPLGRLLLEAVALQLTAIAFALLLGGDRGACVLAATLVSALVVQQRFPRYALFPADPGGSGWERAGNAWIAIAVTAAAMVIALSRDPATRTYQAGGDR